MALLALVDETTEDLIELLADMRIAGLGVSRGRGRALSDLRHAPHLCDVEV